MSCHRAFQRPPLATCDVRQRDARFGGRPPIRVTEQAQYAVMIGEQLARRIEAESGTGPRRRVGCAKEAPADARKLRRRNADAAVADPDDQAAPVIVRVDLDRAIRLFKTIVDDEIGKQQCTESMYSNV